MQAKLSNILFSDDGIDVGPPDYASSITTNYALLHFFTNRSRSSPSWSNFVDFSISSTAFIQNFFVEKKLKSDLPPLVKFERENNHTIGHYESLFFPWLKISIESLYVSFNGRGIVILTGDFHFHHAFLLVKSLRTILKCDLPIEIAYGDNNDLSIEKQRLLLGFKNVRCVDISSLIVLKSMQGMNGWWLKSFAILFSSFKEVIFIDADVLFMQSPEVLFLHPNYKKYGVLLFQDRKVVMQDIFFEMKKEYPNPSETLKRTGLWKETTNHQGESGVLVYNKSKHASFFALLNTCNLNIKPMQDLILKYFHGDKETFWNGFELSLLPYAFVDSYGGALGYMQSNKSVCGALSHSDVHENLVWFNGGLSINKNELSNEIFEFTHYTIDSMEENEGKWHWTAYVKFCWSSDYPREQIKALSTEQKKTIKKYVKIYRDVKNGIFDI